MNNTTKDIVIIGGGPTGLSAAIYNARASLHPLVIEGSPPGGQLILTAEVENYPGFEKGIMGPELIASFRKQALRFETEFITNNVAHITTNVYPYEIELTDKSLIKARAILIATGADAQWLTIESEQRLRGKGVSACATCDGFFFKNKIIAVVGGGDTAMEEALTLTNFASKIYVIHRKSEFTASKIMQDRVLNHPKIEIVWNSNVKEVLGNESVEGVLLDTGKKIDLQGLFIAIGHKPATKFLEGSNVLLDEKGYVITTTRVALENMKKQTPNSKSFKLDQFNFEYQYTTNVKGIFAAGDVIDPHYRQAATAVGMGVAAALEVERFLQDNSHENPTSSK